VPASTRDALRGRPTLAGRSGDRGHDVIAAFPGDPRTAPPSYRYFVGMVERLRSVRPEDLTENSVLLGSAAQITDTLKKVEAAGFDEVILYFNVGLKPHSQVKDEMARFMAEVAPGFTETLASVPVSLG
jgi:hypothetical protein